MSKLSEKTIEKIKEGVLYVLYESGLKALYTQEISDNIVRDNELVLNLLKTLEKIGLVKQVSKYKRRRKWIMTDEAYKKYKELY